VDDLQNAGTARVWCDLPGMVPPSFELDIICCVEIPDPMGPVVVTARFTNSGAQTVIGRRWIELAGPEGDVTTVAGATALAIPPGNTVSERHTLDVPRSATIADYEVRLHWQDSHGVRTDITRVRRPAMR
jgi:hypothetical protein